MIKELKIPKNWSEVKTKNYLRYLDFVNQMKSDIDRANDLKEKGSVKEANEIYMDYLPYKTTIESISILSGIPLNDFDETTMDELNEYSKDIQFVYDYKKMSKNKNPMELIIKDSHGNKFMFKPFGSRNNREVTQMEAFEYLYPDDSVNRIGSTYGVILRGFKKEIDKLTKKEIIIWDAYDFERVEYFKDLILEMPIGDVMGLNDFFLGIHQNLLGSIQKSSQPEKSLKESKV